MEQQYKAFFVTVAAKNGVPFKIARKIVDILETKCDEIDYVVEHHKSGLPHLHVMLLTTKDKRKSDLKTLVQRTVYKFIAKPDCVKGINVLVVDDLDAFEEYIQKTGRILECKFKETRKYVRDNFDVATKIIKANMIYKQTAIKYAYDNYETWKVELSGCKTICERWSRYNYLIKLNSGRSPTTQWKLEFVFESHLTKMGLWEDKPEFSPKKYIKRDKNIDENLNINYDTLLHI